MYNSMYIVCMSRRWGCACVSVHNSARVACMDRSVSNTCVYLCAYA